MLLHYKIEFNTTNSYYKKIIENLISEDSINATCKQYKGFLLLKCDDEEGKIKEFFTLLEQKLPLSIFLGKAQVIDFFNEKDFEELEDKEVLQNIPLLTNEEIVNIVENNEIDFLNDLAQIAKGEKSRIKTTNGFKTFFNANAQYRNEIEENGEEVKLLITNVNNIHNLLEISQKDLQLLCSIERPLVKLKFKLLRNKDKEFSSSNFIYAKLPDDKETVLFSQALQANGIDYIAYTAENKFQDNLKVTYFNEDNVIVSGERALFPKFDYTANEKFNSSKEYFEANGGVFKATLAQYNKRLSSSIGVYFSKSSTNSEIAVNIPSKGLNTIITIPNIYNSIENCLEEIEEIDEHCARLVKNYKEKFATNLEGDVNPDSNGFESIMNMCAKVLGLESAKNFEDLALSTNIKSGIQIDMKLISIDGVNYLDYRKVVQSIMAYKMADVENATLAFSFFESLAEFINNYVNEIAKETGAKDIVFCGDMFSNSVLLSKSHKDLSKTYNILLPKEYPLDYKN